MTKRKLTPTEIESILDFIVPRKGIPKDIAQNICDKNKTKFRNQLVNIEIYPEMIESLKEELFRQYRKTQAEAGDSVGIVTAQSIGERQTQQTLNSFHSTGLTIRTVVAGVPRFTELINATKDPKAVSVKIFFNKKYDTIQELRKNVGNSIKEWDLKSLLKKDPIVFDDSFDPMEGESKKWYTIFTKLFGESYKGYEYGVHLDFDVSLLLENNIQLKDIAKKIEDSYADICCVYSPVSIGKIDIWVNTKEITNEDEIFESDEEARHVYIEEIIIPTIKKLHLFGVEGIKDVFYKKEVNEWVMETDGSNLKELLANPEIDISRTFSNNVWDIYDTFGIEAARNFLIEEFTGVISSDGTFVNDSHTQLLVDIMTYSGTITSISRYGMKKETCGPMAKASFEESLDNFLKAGANGEKETTNGVSAAIMIGKMGKFGTGVCDVRTNISMLCKRAELMNNDEDDN